MNSSARITVTACVTSALAALGIAACGGSSSVKVPVAAPVTVSLIGLNDFHGNIQPPSGGVVVSDPANPAGTKVSAGGAAYLATLISNLKAQNPGNTLVVAAGDMVGASPLASGLFHDEPTIDALGAMGLDISSVGNHEFDKGRNELLRLQKGGCFPASADGKTGVIGTDTCMNNGSFAGAKFQYLAANVIDQQTGATLFPSYAVRTVAGVKIGFIGLTLKDTPTVVTPAGVAGLQFTDEVSTVNKLVPELKAQDVSAIVVLIHQGGAATASVVNDKTCPGFSGDIVAIADQLDPAIDVIVSGHTHQEYVCTRPDGKLLTQTGSYGRIATKIDLTIDPNSKHVTKKDANNLVAVNDVGVKDSTGKVIALPAGMTALAKDANIDALVNRYVGLVLPITGNVVGNLGGFLDRHQNSAGESTLGDVITDAFLMATSDATFGSKRAQIAFTNPGGIRADLSTTLQVSFGQLYNVMPFGNNLVTMDLTGAQLLRLLEQQWEAPQPAGGRIMPVSAGFTYSWDASKPEGAPAGAGARVVPGSMKLNGVPIDLTKTYRVTANSFIASGGDRYTVFAIGTNRQQGGVDLDAAVAYFKSMPSVALP
ncbi:MAG: bifunctional metallophosphatase/5'-nucleotidase, partial [Pseudomonadota bacterium]|nr:bifunctional metallophosphatase/5'-nucleotidase [Pseudomonadota bacterium]